MRARILISTALCAALLGPARSGRAQADDSPPAIDARIAVMRFDALGMDDEIVDRLESLFRREIDRLSKHPLPSPRATAATIQRSRALRRCSGENACLARIGRALKVDVVVSGQVAALGDSYILNIKVVEARSGKELQRLATDPLRGEPDELIDAMRVAAYRLLAPEELQGSISVLTDLVGAQVTLDGEEVGKTPLSGPIPELRLGEHELEVRAEGYMPFSKTVEVRFQKTTRVVVRMTTEDAPEGALVVRERPAAQRWYTSTWFYVGVGVAAAIVGGYVGYQLGHDPVIDCSARPEACSAF